MKIKKPYSAPLKCKCGVLFLDVTLRTQFNFESKFFSKFSSGSISFRRFTVRNWDDVLAYSINGTKCHTSNILQRCCSVSIFKNQSFQRNLISMISRSMGLFFMEGLEWKNVSKQCGDLSRLEEQYPKNRRINYALLKFRRVSTSLCKSILLHKLHNDRLWTFC